MRLLILTLFCVSLVQLKADLVHLNIEDYDNYLFRDNNTSVQLVFTNPNASSTIRTRFLAAFPAGNSGVVVYFNVTMPNKRFPTLPTVTLVDGSLKSLSYSNNFIGIAGKWNLSRDVFIKPPVMGSIRTIRDDEGGNPHAEMPVYPLQVTPTSMSYSYLFLADTISMQFLISTTNNIKFDRSTQIAILPGGIYDFQVTLNLPSLTPLPASRLVRTERQNLLTDQKTSQALNSLAFLIYNEKFLAGGWHFLTYFGRDTMISTRLLLPLLSSEAVEAALSSVFERADKNGQLCHEETIGDYATFFNRQNGHPELGSKPFYDYKMIDTNYELLPLLAAYFLDEPIGKDRAPTFLAKMSGSTNLTYAQILNLNVQLIMDQAQKFAQNPIVDNLIRFKDGLFVGNWRDSEAGNGWGQYPYDVNVALMPSSLLAIERLVNATVLRSQMLRTNAAKYRKVWEDKAMSLFIVTPKFPQESIKGYLTNISLPQTLYSDKDSLPSKVHALSLKDHGGFVGVMHSDFSFNLMYHDALSSEFMYYVVDALQPFPRGLLLENVGLLVSNPVYDLNRTNWNVFTRTAYHGTCVWSFQQSMTIIGLERQLNLCKTSPAPVWCNDTKLVDSLKTARCKLWSIIDANANSDYAETWSWTYNTDNKTFVITNPREFSAKAEEPDAVQLWSFALLAANPPDGCSKSFATSYSNALYLLFTSLCIYWFGLE